MILYHGSEKIIEKPEYGKGKPHNDYGLGFYCTESKDLAKEWAVDINRNGFVNKYEFNFTNQKVLNLNSPEYCILDWLSVLLDNRYFEITSLIAREAREYIAEHFKVDYQKADVIRGYRADDSYFSFALDFLNNNISLQQLNSAMRLGKLGEQIVLKSKKSFLDIKFKNFETVESAIWYPQKKERDETARNEYFNGRGRKRTREDIFVMQIIDNRMTREDIQGGYTEQ